MVRLSPTSMAHLGEAVARDAGKAHFVAGALPGEIVEGDIVLDKGSWARVEMTEVIEPSPERVTPPCRHFGSCGGCQWQYAAYEAQLRWKAEVVAGQLQHLGRIEAPVVRPTLAVGDPYRYRNRMDFAVLGGAPALHRRRSDRLEPLSECHLLLPGLAGLFSELGDLGSARRVTLRMSEATGERHIIIEGGDRPSPDRWQAAISHRTPSGTQVVTGNGAVEEHVGAARLRISGGAFFQNNTAGAAALVALVSEALEPRPGETLLDAYAGGGLFSVTVTPANGRAVAIETSHVAVRDLRHNLKTAGIRDARVVKGSVEESVADLDEYYEIAVVDPPRQGLKEEGVAAVVAARPRALAYVSCDPASLARDAGYLAGSGYRMEWAAPVDLFPQTFHIETVAAFIREDS